MLHSINHATGPIARDLPVRNIDLWTRFGGNDICICISHEFIARNSKYEVLPGIARMVVGPGFGCSPLTITPWIRAPYENTLRGCHL